MSAPRPLPHAGPGARRLDLVLAASLALLSLFFTQGRAASHALLSDKFLFSDEGIGFLVTDVLLRGGTLYKEIAYPYGYLPAYAHAAAAWVGGNTVATYLHYCEAMSAGVLVLVYALLRKVLRPWPAFLVGAVVILPQVITPGGMEGDFISNAAYPLEKTLLLAVALLWREPAHQSWPRACLLGACLGTLQGVKFGTGLMAGAALAVVELICWHRAGFGFATVRVRLRNNLAVLGGFLLLQGLWIAVTLASLPPRLARDTLWPVYVLKNYQEAGALRYPHWQNLGLFLGVQMVPLLGAAGSLWWLGRWCLRRRAAGSPGTATGAAAADGTGGILLLVMFYLLSCFVFLKGARHFNLSPWVLSLGGVYLLPQPWRAARWGAAGVWLLAAALYSGVGSSHPAPPTVPLALDDGEQLWVSEPERREINTLVAALRAPTAPGEPGADAPVVFYPLGAGLYPFFHLPERGRPSWYAPGLVQPYDLAGTQALARSARWVVLTPGPVEKLTADPDEWDRRCGVLGHTLDPAMRDDVRAQLQGTQEIDPACWIFYHPR